MKSFSFKTMFSVVLLVFMATGTALGGIDTPVAINKSVIISVDGIAKISIPDPKIAKVRRMDSSRILINGLDYGSTTMIVWKRGSDKPVFFDIRVIGDATAIESMIRAFAPNDNITVDFAKDTVVLSGKASNEQTVKKAVEIAAAYAPGATTSTTITEAGGIKVTKSETTATKVVNHIVIEQPNQVLLQVKVAQIDKTALKKLGISGLIKGNDAAGYMNTIAAPDGDVGGTSGSALDAIKALDLFQFGVSYFPAGIGAVVQALATKGLAKVLAEPNLLVKTGERGEFRAVSEIPYQIIQTSGGESTATIEYKEVGVKLFFNPEVLETGMIRLKIDPAEVSAITGTMAVNGYPIIDTRSARTNVELKDGESLVIAGLLSEEAIRTMSKIPLLGDIPFLGALFRSTQSDIKEKELVFFITPKLMKPTAPGVKTDLPTDRHPTPEEEKELQWVPAS